MQFLVPFSRHTVFAHLLYYIILDFLTVVLFEATQNRYTFFTFMLFTCRLIFRQVCSQGQEICPLRTGGGGSSDTKFENMYQHGQGGRGLGTADMEKGSAESGVARQLGLTGFTLHYLFLGRGLLVPPPNLASQAAFLPRD